MAVEQSKSRAPLLGEKLTDFTADSTEGKITWSEYIKDSWAILFSHPADYTPVCTTELNKASEMSEEFKKRGVKLAALSIDKVEDHEGWIKDIDSYKSLPGGKLAFPIIADPDRSIAISLGMLDPAERNSAGIALTARCVFVVGPDGTLKLSLLYPASTGRNFDEILRVVDSLQLTANNSVATPANWTEGGECMVLPSVKPEDEAAKFPKGVRHVKLPSEKPYMRFTADPRL